LELIDDAGGQRPFGANHHHVDVVRIYGFEQMGKIGWVYVQILGQRGGTAISGRGKNGADPGAAFQFPNKGVLSPAAADN